MNPEQKRALSSARMVWVDVLFRQDGLARFVETGNRFAV